MKREIRSVLTIVNLAKPDAKRMVDDVDRYLEQQGIVREFFGFSNGPPGEPGSLDWDLAISLGGDGTVLYSSRLLAARGIPILAVNIGDFGFITEVGKHEWQVAFEKYRQGALGISERIMLETSVYRGGSKVARFSGLNDSVISAAGISKVVNLKVYLADTVLGRYRADGVIVSTPTGSTAYSAAAGGPILDPEMRAIILNPICPFTLSNRPLVLQGRNPVNIEVDENQRAEIILTVDGQDVFPLMAKDQVQFEISEYSAHIIRSDKRNFFEVLRSKLNWAGGPYA